MLAHVQARVADASKELANSELLNNPALVVDMSRTWEIDWYVHELVWQTLQILHAALKEQHRCMDRHCPVCDPQLDEALEKLGEW